MAPKKISFGFSKRTNKPNLLPSRENPKKVVQVELIKCLEGQEIKLVEEKPEETPLTIPLKESQKTSTAIASLLKRRAVLLGQDEPELNESSSVDKSHYQNDEDIEKRAARELLAEVQKSSSSDRVNSLVLPVAKPDELPLEGATESTLDDYENIPVQDFGKALLRGMGWTDPLPKANKGGLIDDTPMVRPKGMGLGADKSLSKKPLLVAPEANEVLEIKRNAFVRILGGKYKDLYGQIEGFDDHAGRVIVKLAIGGSKEAFNEFLCQPVAKKEYAQYAKCINSTKYDEYKKKENEYGQIKLDKDDKDLEVKNHYKSIDSYDCYKEEKKDFKNEKDYLRKDEIKNRKKREETYRSADRTWVEYDDKGRGRTNGSGSSRRDNRREDERHCQRDDKKDSKFWKNAKGEKYRHSGGEIFTHKERKTEYDRPQYKPDVGSSDSENNVSSKHKKSKKSHSKKSKKSKLKFRDTSSDTETTLYSTEYSSDNEHERTKKYKKAKKSRKHRERSRSRRR